MGENQLSPKELYEREREARKQDKAGPSPKSSSSSSGSSFWPWVIGVLVLAGVVFGIYKLATMTPPGAGATAGVLADAVTATDWTDGNAKAKVQLVEFSDFQCPACGFYAPWVKQLRTEFKDTLGVTYRHFPLRQIHPNAQVAAQVAEAAGLQGKFWLAADLIFDKQKVWSEQIIARETLVSIVQETGVNLAKLQADIDSDLVKNKIEQDYQSGLRSGVEGTPSFFLNGKKITNPKSYDEFKQLITDAIEA